MKLTYCLVIDAAGGGYELKWDRVWAALHPIVDATGRQYFTVPHRFRPESSNGTGMALESAGMTGFHRNSTGMT